MKTSILEKSHLSKEKLLKTIEHFRQPALNQNTLITKDTINRIGEISQKIRELFPQNNDTGGSSDEIDAVANEHF